MDISVGSKVVALKGHVYSESGETDVHDFDGEVVGTASAEDDQGIVVVLFPGIGVFPFYESEVLPAN